MQGIYEIYCHTFNIAHPKSIGDIFINYRICTVFKINVQLLRIWDLCYRTVSLFYSTYIHGMTSATLNQEFIAYIWKNKI